MSGTVCNLVIVGITGILGVPTEEWEDVGEEDEQQGMLQLSKVCDAAALEKPSLFRPPDCSAQCCVALGAQGLPSAFSEV